MNLKRFKRSLRFLWQRWTRGWDDSDTWNLDSVIAKFALPRLKRFKQLNNGFPYGLTWEEWNEKIDDMIYALDILSQHQYWGDIDRDRYNKGLKDFQDHFCDLWW